MTIAGLDARRLAMGASLAVAVLMLVGKLTAYALTNSTAILSDALESVIHIGATGVAAFGLWFTAQPADRSHPYGHGKFAYFSAGFEGAMIFAAAIAIMVVAGEALLSGPQLRQLDWGLAITGGLALVNLALGLTLVHVGRTRRSLVLEANGRHVLTDVWTSVGVVLGVLLVYLTGVLWLDPLVAIVAGANILYTGGRLMRDSFRGLMEEAVPHDTERLLGVLNAAEASGEIAAFHQLRHRRIADELFVDLHLLMPGALALGEAHQRASDIEERLIALFPDDRVRVMTHLEPEDHDHIHPDGHAEHPDPFLDR